MKVRVWGVLNGDFPCVAKRWQDEDGWCWTVKHTSNPDDFDQDKLHNIMHWMPPPPLPSPAAKGPLK